jgi:ammonia channel protein AmtB
LLYTGADKGFIGTLTFLYNPSVAELTLLAAEEATVEQVKAVTDAGFTDFAGSTIVHYVGGWCALTGAIILGARKGKYTVDGLVNPIPGSTMLWQHLEPLFFGLVGLALMEDHSWPWALLQMQQRFRLFT